MNVMYIRAVRHCGMKLRIINSNLEIKDQDGKNLLLKYDNYGELLEEYDSGLKEMQ